MMKGKTLVKAMESLKNIAVGLIGLTATIVFGYIFLGSLYGVATNGTLSTIDATWNTSLNSSSSTWLGVFDDISPQATLIIGFVGLVVVVLLFGAWLFGKKKKGDVM